MKENSNKLLEILEEHLPSGKKDGSVYTGSAGIAYLYLMLSEKHDNPAYLEVCIFCFVIYLSKKITFILLIVLESRGSD